MCIKAPWGSKVRGQCQAMISLASPRMLSFKIYLVWNVHMHIGGRSWDKLARVAKQGGWPGGRQRPKRIALYETPLYLAPPHKGGHPHPFSPGVHLCLASFSSKQTVSLCALPHVCCAMSLIINSVLAFTVFASMIHAFFTRSKSQGKIASSL